MMNTLQDITRRTYQLLVTGANSPVTNAPGIASIFLLATISRRQRQAFEYRKSLGVLSQHSHSDAHFERLLYRFSLMFRQFSSNLRSPFASPVPVSRYLPARSFPAHGFAA